LITRIGSIENAIAFIIYLSTVCKQNEANIMEKGRFKWQDIAAIAAGL
jgi:hypothetical protein